MPNSKHKYVLFQECIDHSVIADPEFKEASEFTVQCFAASRVSLQPSSHFVEDPANVLWIDLSEVSAYRGLVEDLNRQS